jgi:hypothetical protein
VLATLYGTTDVTALLALNIGLSAPAVIRALSGGVQVDGVPETTRRGRAADATVRRFLAGV